MSGRSDSHRNSCDQLRAEQRLRWSHQDRVSVESLLKAHPDLGSHGEFVLDLIYSEVCLREDLGENTSLSEYRERFPQFSIELERLFTVHNALDESQDQLFASECAKGSQSEGLRVCPQCGELVGVADNRSSAEVICASCGSRLRPNADRTIRIGAAQQPSLGKFQLLRIVGQGAFGTVYQARDQELGRIVAVKVPRIGQFATRQDEDRFVGEARKTAQLRHPGIVPVYEICRTSEFPALVSEFVSGSTLAEALATRKFSFHESAEIVAQAAEALHHAHSLGIIHRDVKPSNLMLSTTTVTDGEEERKNRNGNPSRLTIRVMDFGLARRDDAEITKSIDGQVIGTPAYMSPEQASGRSSNVDARADVYGLGVVLYQLLTGELPFRGNVRMLLEQVLRDPPTRPLKLNDQIPLDLDTITVKCLEKDPARRYDNARELAFELRSFQRGIPIPSRPISTSEQWWRWCKRQPVVASLIAAVSLSLVLITLVSCFAAIRELHRRQEAERHTRLANSYRLAAEARAIFNKKNELALAMAVRAVVPQLHHGELPPEPAINALQQAISFVVEKNAKEEGIRGHKIAAKSMAISNDGNWLVTTTCDLVPHLWNMKDPDLWNVNDPAEPIILRSQLKRRSDDPDDVKDSILHHARTPRVWDLSHFPKATSFVLTGHERLVTCVAISSDNRLVATGSVDGTVRIWDLKSLQQPRLILEGEHKKGITCIAFSPDGNSFATGSSDHLVCVWNLTGAMAGQVAVRLTKHQKQLYCTEFSPDGSMLVTAGDDDLALLWNCNSFESDPLELGPHLDAVDCVNFSRDGLWLATGDNEGGLFVWDLQEARNLFRNPSGTHSLAPHQITEKHPRSVLALAFSPTSQFLATASRESVCWLWKTCEDSWNDTPHERFKGHDNIAMAVNFSPNGEWLLTGSEDNTGLLRRLSSLGQDPAQLESHYDGSVRSVGFLSRRDELWAVTSCWDRTVPLDGIPPEKLVDVAKHFSEDRQFTLKERDKYHLDDVD